MLSQGFSIVILTLWYIKTKRRTFLFLYTAVGKAHHGTETDNPDVNQYPNVQVGFWM